MRVSTTGLFSFLALVGAAFAQSSTASAPESTQTIVITVGLNTTNNASAVFQPASVKAKLGDTVIFNFTQGNHTATESTFVAPCVRSHDFNITLNGFDSGIRVQPNGTSSILSVPILDDNANRTMWFFDLNTCGEGGVGVINANDSSTETYAGFVRNAERLNGTSTSSVSSFHSATGTSASSTSTSDSNSATYRAAVGGAVALPLLLITLLL